MQYYHERHICIKQYASSFHKCRKVLNDNWPCRKCRNRFQNCFGWHMLVHPVIIFLSAGTIPYVRENLACTPKNTAIILTQQSIAFGFPAAYIIFDFSATK